MKYDLRHETAPGRCAWCWEKLPEVESHTAISPVQPPYFDGPLRFHHRCWPEYLALARFAAPAKGTGLVVTPASLEKLRIHSHLSRRDFSRRLKISQERCLAIIGGRESLINDSVIKLARTLAGETQYGRNPDRIDWTLPQTVFCLRAHSGKTVREFARDLGVSQQAYSIWEQRGVPRNSMRIVHRLDRMARVMEFDAGMTLADRAWTPECLTETLKKSGISKTTWAIRAGCAGVQIHDWAAGRKAISRLAAWKLTRAAIGLGAELPPEIYRD